LLNLFSQYSEKEYFHTLAAIRPKNAA